MYGATSLDTIRGDFFPTINESNPYLDPADNETVVERYVFTGKRGAIEDLIDAMRDEAARLGVDIDFCRDAARMGAAIGKWRRKYATIV